MLQLGVYHPLQSITAGLKAPLATYTIAIDKLNFMHQISSNKRIPKYTVVSGILQYIALYDGNIYNSNKTQLEEKADMQETRHKAIRNYLCFK